MVISTETHESQDFVKPTIMYVDFGNFLKIGGTNFDFLGSNPLLSGSRQCLLTDYPGERLCVMSKSHH